MIYYFENVFEQSLSNKEDINDLVYIAKRWFKNVESEKILPDNFCNNDIIVSAPSSSKTLNSPEKDNMLKPLMDEYVARVCSTGTPYVSINIQLFMTIFLNVEKIDQRSEAIEEVANKNPT